MTTLSIEIYTGNDSDCDTCGGSYNSLSYEYDLITGEHRASSRFGCYGTDEPDGTTAAEVIPWLRGESELAETGAEEIDALINFLTSEAT